MLSTYSKVSDTAQDREYNMVFILCDLFSNVFFSVFHGCILICKHKNHKLLRTKQDNILDHATVFYHKF